MLKRNGEGPGSYNDNPFRLSEKFTH